MNDAPNAADDRASYAGFWRRFAAYAIDYVLVAVISIALRLVAMLLGRNGNAEFTLTLLATYFLYCTLLESSSWQATVGKRALGLRVTNESSERIGLARAAIRFVAKLLSVLTLFVGYLLVVVTRRRQALHDLIAGTFVIHDATARRPAWLLSAAVSLPVLSVVAGMAFPSYQDYAIRAQVSEGLDLASGYRAAIESQWRNSQRDFAEVTSDFVGAALPQSGRYVESIEVVSGMIQITYGAEANGAVAGHVLSLVPALDSQRTLAWACGYGQPPSGFDVLFENPAGYTDIEERFVPSTCRAVR